MLIRVRVAIIGTAVDIARLAATFLTYLFHHPHSTSIHKHTKREPTAENPSDCCHAHPRSPAGGFLILL